MSETIGCAVMDCVAPAVVGGIFEHKPNGMRPAYPVYYWCTEHAECSDGALKTWAVET